MKKSRSKKEPPWIKLMEERRNIPFTLADVIKCVSRCDFETALEGASGKGRPKSTTRNNDNGNGATSSRAD